MSEPRVCVVCGKPISKMKRADVVLCPNCQKNKKARESGRVVQALNKFIDERIQNVVDNQVVRVFEEYGVRDRNGDPVKYS